MARLAYLLNGEETHSRSVSDRTSLAAAYMRRPLEGTHRGCRLYGSPTELEALGAFETECGWLVDVAGEQIGAAAE